jgi:hypothetical protein
VSWGPWWASLGIVGACMCTFLAKPQLWHVCFVGRLLFFAAHERGVARPPHMRWAVASDTPLHQLPQLCLQTQMSHRLWPSCSTIAYKHQYHACIYQFVVQLMLAVFNKAGCICSHLNISFTIVGATTANASVTSPCLHARDFCLVHC